MENVLFFLAAAVIVCVLATIVEKQAKKQGINTKKQSEENVLDYDFIRECLWNHLPLRETKQLMDESFCFMSVPNLEQVVSILEDLTVKELNTLNNELIFDMQIYHSCKNEATVFGKHEQASSFNQRIISIEALKMLVDNKIKEKTT